MFPCHAVAQEFKTVSEAGLCFLPWPHLLLHWADNKPFMLERCSLDSQYTNYPFLPANTRADCSLCGYGESLLTMKGSLPWFPCPTLTSWGLWLCRNWKLRNERNDKHIYDCLGMVGACSLWYQWAANRYFPYMLLCLVDISGWDSEFWGDVLYLCRNNADIPKYLNKHNYFLNYLF